MFPDVAKCPLGAPSPVVENHRSSSIWTWPQLKSLLWWFLPVAFTFWIFCSTYCLNCTLVPITFGCELLSLSSFPPCVCVCVCVFVSVSFLFPSSSRGWGLCVLPFYLFAILVNPIYLLLVLNISISCFFLIFSFFYMVVMGV